MKHDDDGLSRRVLEGDDEAVGLVIRWISQVLAWPRFWALRSERPDLVQETLARVLASLKNGQFDRARDLHPYVQGIARHAALQALEAASRHRGRDGGNGDGHGDIGGTVVDPVTSEPGPTDDIARRELVRRVMDEASEECGLLMRLYFLEGKSYEEIAGELVIPVGTVKSRLSRCLDAAQRTLRVGVRRPTTPHARNARDREDTPG